MRRLILAALLGLMTHAAVAQAQQPVLLHAAGSLRAALTEVAQAFEATTKVPVTRSFRPSGLLRDALSKGEAAEVFASANMAHPLALAQEGKAGPVVLFARNETCAFARAGLEVTTETLLARMLDPAIKLGTSTPKADPSGDYAWQVFAKAEALKPGAKAALEAKALQLVGGPDSAPTPATGTERAICWRQERPISSWAIAPMPGRSRANSLASRWSGFPPALAVGADYGMTVMNGASANGYRLAMFILSPEGQRILAKHGFTAPTSPREGI